MCLKNPCCRCSFPVLARGSEFNLNVNTTGRNNGCGCKGGDEKPTRFYLDVDGEAFYVDETAQFTMMVERRDPALNIVVGSYWDAPREMNGDFWSE